MKQASRLMLCIGLIFALLAGCGLSDSVLRRYGASDGLMGAETRESQVLEARAPLYTDAEPPLLWGRDQLDDHARAAYDEMSRAIAAYRQTPLVVDADTDEIQKILAALRIDHPEYFWFDGKASFVTKTLAGVPIETECSFTYTLDPMEIQEAHQQIRQYTAACLNSLGDTEDDYQRILGVYRYLIETTDYVTAESDQSILSAMSRHQATCAGYARSFQYLMGQLGIPCVLATGEMEDGEAHGWNIVKCNGSWYQMDVTWGDPVDPDGTPGSSVQYTYCLVTDEEILRDHIPDDLLPMPVCTATADNYFIRERLQFDVWDREAYTAAMAEAVIRGQECFDVRFSSPAAYEEAMDALFSQEQIWEILADAGVQAETSVNYSSKDLHLEISVRLHSGGN